MNQIITKKLDAQWEESAIPLNLIEKQNNGKKLKAESLEFVWQDVAGSPNGNIEIYFSNSEKNKSFSCSFAIDSADNSNDSDLFVLQTDMQFLILNFIPNGITDGKLTITINYR